MENERSNAPAGGLSPRALRHAVREYLANDLGVDKAYVDRVIAGIVAGRNIDGIVRTELQKYFHKGPDGFKAGEIVGERVAAKVDAQVQVMMDGGVRDALRAAVDRHVRQMTDGPAAERMAAACSGKRCAVYLSTDAILGAFRASLHYALSWAEPCEHGLAWEIRAKPETTYAAWLADDVAEVFGVDKKLLRADGGVLHVPPAAVEKILAVLFPWLGGYDRSFRFADGVLFVYDEKTAGPDKTRETDAGTPGTESPEAALLAEIREIAKNPVAFDAWPEDAKKLYELARAYARTEDRNERTDENHA